MINTPVSMDIVELVPLSAANAFVYNSRVPFTFGDIVPFLGDGEYLMRTTPNNIFVEEVWVGTSDSNGKDLHAAVQAVLDQDPFLRLRGVHISTRQAVDETVAVIPSVRTGTGDDAGKQDIRFVRPRIYPSQLSSPLLVFPQITGTLTLNFNAFQLDNIGDVVGTYVDTVKAFLSPIFRSLDNVYLERQSFISRDFGITTGRNVYGVVDGVAFRMERLIHQGGMASGILLGNPEASIVSAYRTIDATYSVEGEVRSLEIRETI